MPTLALPGAGASALFAGEDEEEERQGGHQGRDDDDDEDDDEESTPRPSAASAAAGDEMRAMTTKRKRKQRCYCRCCACDRKSISATTEELESIIKAMHRLRLQEDVIVGGELVGRKAKLLKVGGRFKRRPYDDDQETLEAGKEALEEASLLDNVSRLTFQMPRPPLPWCIILKCPSGIFCLTLVAVLAVCALGITGNVTIDTNFDSFMDSDSDSSLYYNAFLLALEDNSQDRRRLGEVDCDGASAGDRCTPRQHQPRWREAKRATAKSRRSGRTSGGGGLALGRRLQDLLQFGPGSPHGGEAKAEGEGEWWQHAGLVLHSGNASVEEAPHAEHRRLQGNLYKNYEVALAYMAMDGQAITNDHVARMQRIELSLRGTSLFHSLCDTSEPSMKILCSPGSALANVAYPAPEQVSPTEMKRIFNGSATVALPLDLVVKTVVQQGIQLQVFPSDAASSTTFEVEGLRACDNKAGSRCEALVAAGQCLPFATHEMYMMDFCRLACGFCSSSTSTSSVSDSSATPTRVEVVRSVFKFQAFCCTTATPNQGAALQDLEDRWNQFVEFFVTTLQQEDRESRGSGLRIFYTGTGVEGHEALAATMQDLLWAVGSFAFVLFYATLHTRSIFLSTMGLLLVLLSIPTAMSIFFMASGMESISLMSCLSFFIVIGIGSDMVFVYTDFWKQSLSHSRDRARRLRFTYLQASTSTAATTFTTAMSFLANLASVLRPLREFGFFMGCCVLSAWLIIFIGYPPILVLGERCHRCIRRNMIRNMETVMSAATDQVTVVGSMGSRPGKAMSRGARQSMWAVAEALDPEKKGVGEMHRQLLGTRFAEFVHAWKRALLIAFTVLTTVSLLSSVRNLRQASGVPEVFPSDHNQVLGKEYFDKFNNFNDDLRFGMWPSRTECTDLFSSCWLYRCRTIGRAQGSESNCTCFPENEPDLCLRLAERRVEMRVMTRGTFPPNVGDSAKYVELLQAQYPEAQRVQVLDGSTSQADCITEHWESGDVQMASVLSVPAIDVSFGGGGTPECLVKQICYCGVERCEDSFYGGGSRTGDLLLGSAGRLLSDPMVATDAAAILPGPPRLLQAATVQIPADKLVDVNIVIGIEITGTNPLLGEQKTSPYEFRSTFEIQDPWTQRGMYDLCVNLPEDLLVGSVTCWMIGFRDFWMQVKGKDWPLRPTEDANAEYYSYALTSKTNGFLTDRFFWLGPGMQVLGTYFPCYLTVPNTIDADEALDIKAKWDEYFNALEPPMAGTWHASRLWMRAEAQKVIIDSTIATLAISLGCVFLGVVVFTRSTHLALLVMFVVMSIIICLLFFMTVIMAWPIGAIEVLSLIVFVGFAVDYCLHVAHKYHTCHIHNVEVAPVVEATSEKGASESLVGATPSSTPAATELDRGESGEMADSTSRTRGSARRHSLNVLVQDTPMAAKGGSPSGKQRMSKLLAQKRPEERFARTKYALERMGSAVVGSAFTTVGCSAFLLPCQLAIFTQIGSVVMAVTLYAIIYTLFPLPSLLMLLGPCGNDLQAMQRKVLQLGTRMRKAAGRDRRFMSRYANEPARHVRFVLHLPPKCMAECETAPKALRTRIRANG